MLMCHSKKHNYLKDFLKIIKKYFQPLYSGLSQVITSEQRLFGVQRILGFKIFIICPAQFRDGNKATFFYLISNIYLT